jgi:hypothetical protein
MADVHTKEIRSKNTAAIKGKIQSLKCWWESFYRRITTGNGYTINAALRF